MYFQKPSAAVLAAALLVSSCSVQPPATQGKATPGYPGNNNQQGQDKAGSNKENGINKEYNASGTDTNEDDNSFLSSTVDDVNLDVDPSKAYASLVSGPTLQATSSQGTIKIPTLNIGFKPGETADYVQILRCKPDVELSYLGQHYTEIPQDYILRRDRMKRIWTEAVASLESCRFAASYFSSEYPFQDLAAPSGEFLYIFNPCFHIKDSDEDNCSYEFVVTPSVIYENSMEAKFYEKARELSVYEGKVMGLNSQLLGLARKMMVFQNSCEEEYAVEQSIKNFWKGLATFVAAGVGAAIGGAFSGGAAALQGAKTAMGIATAIVNKIESPPLVCPQVEDLRGEFIEKYKQVPVYVEKGLEVRKEMAQMNAAYTDIETRLFEITTTGE